MGNVCGDNSALVVFTPYLRHETRV